MDGKEHFCHICQLYGKAELKKKLTSGEKKISSRGQEALSLC